MQHGTRLGKDAALAIVALLVVALGTAPATADPYADGDLSSYAYVEAIDGRGTIDRGWNEEQVELEVNFPLLAGDRLTLERGARAALVLPDRTRIRLEGQGVLSIAALALAREDAATVSELYLLEGEMQVLIDESFIGDRYPIVDTPIGTVYLHEPGSYVLYTDGAWTSATTRAGFAELSTEHGSSIIRSGEALAAEPGERIQSSVQNARGESGLERWSAGLDRYDERGRDSGDYLDPTLGYASGDLERHGAWLNMGGRYAWSPRVATGWRPYYDGRWVPTPSGLTWVSGEPWGWLTYHYGTWDFSIGAGWVWYPGRVYSPAWVYWHWSDSYVGWVPTGYYSRYYGGLHLGVHGWASAGWRSYRDWNFCRTRDIGRYDFRSYVSSGRDLGRTARLRDVPRGVVTTETRPLGPDEFRSPERFAERVGRAAGSRPGDASAFVQRRNDLPPDLDRSVRSRVVVPRVDAGRAAAPPAESSGLRSRAPVLRSGAPSRPQDGDGLRGRIEAAPQPRAQPAPPSRPLPGSGRRYVAPDRRVDPATPRRPSIVYPKPRSAAPDGPGDSGATGREDERPMRYVAPDRAVRQPAPRPTSPRAQPPGSQPPRVQAPPAGASGSNASPRRLSPSRVEPPRATPSRGSTVSPRTAPPPRRESGQRVLENIRSHRRAAPPRSTAPPPRATEAPRASESPGSTSAGSSSSRRSSSASSGSSRESSPERSSKASSSSRSSGSKSDGGSSARRSRPSRSRSDDDDR